MLSCISSGISQAGNTQTNTLSVAPRWLSVDSCWEQEIAASLEDSHDWKRVLKVSKHQSRCKKVSLHTLMPARVHLQWYLPTKSFSQCSQFSALNFDQLVLSIFDNHFFSCVMHWSLSYDTWSKFGNACRKRLSKVDCFFSLIGLGTGMIVNLISPTLLSLDLSRTLSTAH
jgi:hypothetical protein